MPPSAIPQKSGAHRFACLALYRALLRRCSPRTNNNDASWTYKTKSLVKQRFSRYKNLQSPSQVANSLKAGYQALDLLESASKGNSQDVKKVATILSQTQAIKDEKSATLREFQKLNPPKPPSARDLRKQKTIQAQVETQRRHPNATSILERPRPQVSGKRRVPVLVNARGVPFLRIKKPQPRNVSGVIRNLLATRWHKIEIRTRLQGEMLFARDEDAWDKLTVPESSPSPTWASAVQYSIDEVNAYVRKWDHKRRDTAERMWEIVLQERKLAAKEEEQRRTESENRSEKT